ncbi:MAG: right-handed parallel beta-helix repeat-containing protein [Thermoproteota archaeon]|nr:right-handed parallel beta-helix repeat-containing protein [Nitrosopumilus sp.]MDQ3083590.1 right-handed parallel beta-helix repeat-containing protein [Thermoproteota archaeon]
MNNKIYLMAALIAFASVGALLIQPTVASAQSSMIDNILNSALPSSNTNDNNQPSQASSSSSSAVPLSTSLSCGQVIKQSVKLTANLDCKTDGIIVGADGITIDLNGFTLSGPGEKSSKVGIMFADNDGVTVQGPGTIKSFQAGALFSGGEDNKISRATFTENEIAVFETGSKNVVIEDNMMFGNSIGVAAHSSSGSKLTTNLFKSNDLAGVTLVNSASNELSMNTIQGSVNGIFLDGQSSKNNVNSNMVLQNRGVDLNNGNGLPTNINENVFTDNNCNTSVPVGLCLGR